MDGWRAGAPQTRQQPLIRNAWNWFDVCKRMFACQCRFKPACNERSNVTQKLKLYCKLTTSGAVKMAQELK
jgi:hypothetical protein